jgi:hypothetical protein
MAYKRGLAARRKPKAYAPKKRKIPYTAELAGSRNAPVKMDWMSA